MDSLFSQAFTNTNHQSQAPPVPTSSSISGDISATHSIFPSNWIHDEVENPFKILVPKVDKPERVTSFGSQSRDSTILPKEAGGDREFTLIRPSGTTGLLKR